MKDNIFDLATSKGYEFTSKPLIIYDIVSWLRETHDVHCHVLPVTASDGRRLYASWTEFEWCTAEDMAKNDTEPYFEDYFEALEDAVKEGLKVIDRKP